MFQFLLMCNRPFLRLLCLQMRWVRNLDRFQRDGLSLFHSVCGFRWEEWAAGETIWRCFYSCVWCLYWCLYWLGYQLGLLTGACICSLSRVVWASLQHGGNHDSQTSYTVTQDFKLQCSGKEDRKCTIFYHPALEVTKHYFYP